MDALDERLAAMTAEMPADAEAEARRVARAMTPTRRVRKRWMLPVLVGGAVALTAGTSVGVATMSHWAGVGMPLENIRNEQPIPVDWVTESGHQERCRAWIELRNPQERDRDLLDAAVLAHDWAGLGQRLYDESSPKPDDDADGESRVGRGIEPVLQDFVGRVFPGIGWLGEGAGAKARAGEAYGFTCVPEAE